MGRFSDPNFGVAALTEAEQLEQRGQQRLPMAEEPAFLDDEGPSDDLPTHITRAKKGEL